MQLFQLHENSHEVEANKMYKKPKFKISVHHPESSKKSTFCEVLQ